MGSSLQDRFDNELSMTSDLVWITRSDIGFAYSDGVDTERYLKRVFTTATDLTTESDELEQSIRDWASEYHLSKKRPQLLSGFDFSEAKVVLEVGCGCGAITRLLGERFDEVVAVEGNLARAKLARLRTRGMENVSIVCAPFQDLRFRTKFDMVFCVGVLEYSGSYIDARDPYDTALKTFRSLLNPGGTLVVAIENQFGLKYFASCTEDHTNRMFEGIEGYPVYRKVRTFGYDELRFMLGRYFKSVDFYFPYPDYKLPSCVLSESFLQKAQVGELVGNFPSRDYSGRQTYLFDERLACIELGRNYSLPFFANSFLVMASDSASCHLRSKPLGYLYTTDRAVPFCTITQFEHDAKSSVVARKRRIKPSLDGVSGMLRIQETISEWRSELSLHATLVQRTRHAGIGLEEMFHPCTAWVSTLRQVATLESGVAMIDGAYIDCTWKNSFVSSSGECVFIDKEWIWSEPLPLHFLVIRSVYCYLSDIYKLPGLPFRLKSGNTKTLIRDISALIGVRLSNSDFREFVDLESRFYGLVSGREPSAFRIRIAIYLWSRNLSRMIDLAKRVIVSGRSGVARARRVFARFWP